MPNPQLIDANVIFNLDKTDYETTPLFLGQPKGLIDTINVQYPVIDKLYNRLRSQDWREDEFDYSSCALDFMEAPKNVSDMMIRTLAWQWEADSLAANQLVPIALIFATASELVAAFARIGENEVLHGRTYSTIIRSSFPHNPSGVLRDILSVKESLQRVEPVRQAFRRIYTRAHQYALGLVPADQDTYNMAFLLIVLQFIMERCQFMPSFAYTFGICDMGIFAPIGKAVQKIMQDEFDIHVEFGREVLRIEMLTERGRRAYVELLPEITLLIDSVVKCELDWVKYMHSEGRGMAGYSQQQYEQWAIVNAYDAYKTLGIEMRWDLRDENPLPYMRDWMKFGVTQGAAQEEHLGQYRLNVVCRNDYNKTWKPIQRAAQHNTMNYVV